MGPEESSLASQSAEAAPDPDSAAASSESTAEPPPRDNDEAYEQAFQKFLAPESTQSSQDQTEQTEQAGDEGAAQPAESESQAAAPDTPSLSDDQKQLLSRLHMTPEMMAGWSESQRAEFLDNAAKREADQTRGYKELRDRLSKLESAGADGQSEQAGASPQGEGTGQAERFADEARKVADEAVEVYGDEIKPLGEMTVKMAGQLDQMTDRVDQAEQSGATKDRLIVEMTIDSGLRDLKSEYPSLDKADARQQVIDRFQNDWKSESSRHREAEGPLLDRVRNALKDAAEAEFGNQSESAAQVNLANQTKERLRNQPQAGAGKGRKAELTEDDVYDRAFEQTIGKELSR